MSLVFIVPLLLSYYIDVVVCIVVVYVARHHEEFLDQIVASVVNDLSLSLSDQRVSLDTCVCDGF